jgi:transposase InsO family protein
VQNAYIELGSPWENGYGESFNGKFRDQFLSGEIFYNLKEAAILIARWRYHSNHVRPHSSVRFRPPAPLTKLPAIEAPSPLVHDRSKP